MKRLKTALLIGLVGLVTPGWADVSNTGYISFKDQAGTSYGPTSSAVSIQTPPVFAGSVSCTGDVNAAFTCSIAATNGPDSYSIIGGALPTGLSLNTATGQISGTTSQSGVFNRTAQATNEAGTASTPLQITIRSVADVRLTKRSDVTTAKSGDTITFTLEYQNVGGGNATEVVITDDIPAGTTFVNGSITGGGVKSGNTITWTIGSVATGAPKASVSFKVTVN